MTVDHLISLVIFVIAIVGVGVTARRLRISTRVLRSLLRRGKVDPGVEVMTRGHVRSDRIKVYIHGVFIFTGVVQLIPHVRYDGWFWLGLGVVIAMQVLLIFDTVAAGKDQEKVAGSFQAKK